MKIIVAQIIKIINVIGVVIVLKEHAKMLVKK